MVGLEQSEKEIGQLSIPCPACGGDAVYKYGKAWTGRQRFLCLVCGKQYTNGARVSEVQGKPRCQKCRATMNVYKIEGAVIRFRCSRYPECRTYKKFLMTEEKQ